jgi:hypothetical protein
MIAQASANASHGWYETGAAVDAKKWDALAGGGSLYFRILSDNEGTANTWLTLNRTGATPTSVSLNVANIVLFGATAINGYITITLNIGAVYPPTAPFSAFGWNFLNGNGETDYWNNFTSATMAHTFWQRTGTSTSTRLADISPTGAVTAYGGFVVNAATGPTIRAGTGAATGTQPKGSLWLRTDGAAGSTLYVTQGGGTWAAVTGV